MRDQQPNRSTLSRSSSDEALGLQREYHLVHGRRRDSKIALHVGFRRCSAADLGHTHWQELLRNARSSLERDTITLFTQCGRANLKKPRC